MLMHSVVVLQFNFGFLNKDAGEAIHLIILFLYLFWATFSVLENYQSYLSQECFILLMWPVLLLKFNCINDAGGVVHLIFLFLLSFWAAFSVLGCVRKLLIIPITKMIHLMDVATIGLTIQLWDFCEMTQEEQYI